MNGETKSLAEKNAYHIEVMNSEMGELRDAQKNSNFKVETLDRKLERVATDVSWLKKYHWLLTGAQVSSLAGIISILLFK